MACRTFHFSDGNSNKFWSIEVTGTKTLVHFGKIGTAGQAQEKDWPSEAAAKAAGDKLIAEKTHKGYVEQAGGTSAAVPAPVVRPSKPKSPQAPKPAADIPPARAPATPIERDSVSVAAPPSLDRSVTLRPEEWFVVTWKDHEPLPKQVPPFDRDDGLRRLAAACHAQDYAPDWSKAKVPLHPSPEESVFWLEAVLCFEWGRPPERFLAAMKGKKRAGKFSAADLPKLKQHLLQSHREAGHCFRCVASALALEDLVEGIRSDLLHGHIDEEISKCLIPWLTKEEREKIRTWIAGAVSGPMPGDFDQWPDVCYLAAAVGCHAEMKALLATVPDGYYKTHPHAAWYHRPLAFVHGLGSRDEVISEFRRLGLTLNSKQEARAWIALTEWHALEYLESAVCASGNKQSAVEIAEALQAVAAPEAAAVALGIYVNSKAGATGLAWLDAHPLHAVVGLVPTAMGKGKLAEAAADYLSSMRRTDQRETLETAVGLLPADQAQCLRREILDVTEIELPDFDPAAGPDELREALESQKPAPAAGAIQLAALPPLQVGAARLNDEQLRRLAAELKSADPAVPGPVARALSGHADRSSLDRFAWKLFESWLGLGAPSKEKWAMVALGHLGSDAIALKLAPLVRKWPGESQHPRAVLGLQVLRAIGTDTALMQLNGIAQKVPFKGLKERARELMDDIAKDRGLTKAQLEDRIVPDCGLDERGTRTFNFGPRQFEFILTSDLKPMIREASGKKRPDLPAPNSSDDPALSAQAVEEWKVLKKTLRDVLKIQTERLEQAMVTGRRWTTDEFLTLLVRHPLITHISRWVVWACYDSAGKVSHTFRVTEDQSLADTNDNAFTLPADAPIGLVHPLQLNDAAKNAWGQVLGDYEIIQPFPQLARPVFGLEPSERKGSVITRGKGRKIAAGSMFGIFEKNGWIRDQPADAGGYAAHSKPFPAASITAFAQYEPGMWIGGSMAEQDDQEVTKVYFVPGLRGPDWWSSHKDQIPLAEVDSIVLSEVLRDLETILSKTK